MLRFIPKHVDTVVVLQGHSAAKTAKSPQIPLPVLYLQIFSTPNQIVIILFNLDIQDLKANYLIQEHISPYLAPLCWRL